MSEQPEPILSSEEVARRVSDGELGDGYDWIRFAQLQTRISEADRLLRVAYADAHPEDVPVDVLAWLNPEVST